MPFLLSTSILPLSFSIILKERDKLREKHYNYYTGKVWGDARNYHACFNSDFIGINNVVDIIEKMAIKKK